jgi:hypothetical protein
MDPRIATEGHPTAVQLSLRKSHVLRPDGNFNHRYREPNFLSYLLGRKEDHTDCVGGHPPGVLAQVYSRFSKETIQNLYLHSSRI